MALLLLVWGAHCAGERKGRANERVHALDTARTTLKKEVKGALIISARSDSVAKREVEKVIPLRVQYRTERVPELKLKLADMLVTQDSIAIAALQTANAKKDSVIFPLAKLDTLSTTEINILKDQKAPRFGFKTGLAAGVLAVAAIVFLLK